MTKNRIAKRATRRKPGRDVLASIGRLIRACAEIEDMTMLHICNLAEISEAKGMIIFERANYSRMRSTAEQLAKLHSKEALLVHKNVFTKNLNRIFHIRNVVAHGAFIGRNEEGSYIFLTAERYETEPDRLAKKAIAYSGEHLNAVAQAAEKTIPLIEGELKLKQLRAREYARAMEEV